VLELERPTVVGVRANVLGVSEHLVYGQSGPGPVVFSKDVFPVEYFGNLPFRFPLANEQLINVPDDRNLIFGSGTKMTRSV
jgi:hypothetical protein